MFFNFFGNCHPFLQNFRILLTLIAAKVEKPEVRNYQIETTFRFGFLPC